MRYFYLRTSDRILMKFDISKIIMSQNSYFKFQTDPLTLGRVEGGNRKSWKTLYVIDITGLDPLSLGELGGEVNSVIWKKQKKRCIFNLRPDDQILVKFDI